MPKEQKKLDWENSLFRNFAVQMKWPVADGDIVHQMPPEPDILYKGLGAKVAFEIASIIEPELATSIAKAKNAIAFSASPNCTIVLRKKLLKAYSGEHPVELLLCHSGAIVPDDYVVPELQMDIGAANSVGFRRIWYSGEHQAYLIFPIEESYFRTVAGT